MKKHMKNNHNIVTIQRYNVCDQLKEVLLVRLLLKCVANWVKMAQRLSHYKHEPKAYSSKLLLLKALSPKALWSKKLSIKVLSLKVLLLIALSCQLHLLTGLVSDPPLPWDSLLKNNLLSQSNPLFLQGMSINVLARSVRKKKFLPFVTVSKSFRPIFFFFFWGKAH
jgi:hypothetical protein